MAKKSSTVHLEESTWREIDEYKDKNGCSSRNDAIERMFTERRLLLNLNYSRNGSQDENEVSCDKEEDNEYSQTDQAIESAFSDMPDK